MISTNDGKISHNVFFFFPSGLTARNYNMPNSIGHHRKTTTRLVAYKGRRNRPAEIKCNSARLLLCGIFLCTKKEKKKKTLPTASAPEKKINVVPRVSTPFPYGTFNFYEPPVPTTRLLRWGGEAWDEADAHADPCPRGLSTVVMGVGPWRPTHLLMFCHVDKHRVAPLAWACC